MTANTENDADKEREQDRHPEGMQESALKLEPKLVQPNATEDAVT